MAYARKIVLHSISGETARLSALVEDFIASGVKFVGVVGPDCAKIEDIVDEIVVGDGSGPERFILTSSHPDESLADAIEFADCLVGEYAGEVQVVEL